uniref:histidine kinase n=1 Tax=uncultured prokaryote TaxID=198431 RepID=A0A0H5QEL0_9ZZZZ|nr:hypothetical protein [uncultured prokaryote]
MIRKLRIKFICASMVSLALVLAVILGGINLAGYRRAVEEADEILDLLAQGEGRFPPELREGRPPQRRDLSPELPFEARFFSVFLGQEGGSPQVDTGRIAAVDRSQAVTYAEEALDRGRERGFLGSYRYLTVRTAAGTRVIFLDCGRSLGAVGNTLAASAGVSLAGLGAVLVLLALLSGRIVKPLAENEEKQRRFITDAGHEIKTPLTIIGADADLLELELGESEWLTDIRRQTQRLSALTRDLICLARMDEERPRGQPLPFCLSDVVEETAQSFQAPARSGGGAVETRLQPLLTCTGDEEAIRRLVGILLDNGVKYAPAGARVSVELRREGRWLRLTVTNPTLRPMAPEEVERMFDRFYRGDQSRGAGGYGLGLAIARSIVDAHRGRIRAAAAPAGTLSVTVLLPAGPGAKGEI